ncbi:MAG: CHAT domain-containing protein [Anaerolinea sp.]|nr:CHAT domain-containing protein [Anaerolinea sp.]
MTQANKSTPTLLRVLVVENDPQWRGDHVMNLKRWGYAAWAAEPTEDTPDQFEALRKDAIDKAKHYRCHVALVDMRLKNDDDPSDTSGLNLVRDLAPTVSIIVSGHGDRKTARDALKSPPDVPERAYDFVGKEDGPEVLKKAIEEVERETWHWREVEFVSSPAFACDALARCLTALGDGQIQADEVEDMLRRLFPAAKRLKIEAVNEAQRKGLSVPRGHSIVVKVTQDEHFSSYVVKLTTTTHEAREWTTASDELKRFNKVRPFFTGLRFAAVVGSPVRLWNLMGIVYEFLAGDEDRPICSLADYYRDNSAEDINNVLSNIRRFWRRLYEKRTQQRKSVFQAYDMAWNRKLSQRLIEFRTYSLSYPDALVKLNLPDPFTWLADMIVLQDNGNYQDGGLPDTTFADCHGDLHSENIFTDTHQDVWLIDYERTGEGPLLQDFAELENDILTSLVDLQATEAEQFAQLVCALIESNSLVPEQQLALFPADSEAGKAFTVIHAWRELACSVLGASGGDRRQYYYGLLFNALFRLTLLLREQGDKAFVISGKLSQATRCLILAGMLCHRLDKRNIGQMWPPKEWETTLNCLPQQEPPEIAPSQPKPIKDVSAHPVKILFLSANPSDTASLQLDEEIRAIDNALQQGSLRDYFQVAIHTAVRTDDLQGLLERYQPDIVHFSGHGGSNGQIYLQGKDGKGHPVAPHALGNLFKLLKKNIRCVVLNACYSDIQAQAIVQHINAVIGMSHTISDEAAIKFAAGFYESLAWGHNVQEAFDLGCARIDLANLDEQDKPNLLARPGCHPNAIIFARTPVTESTPPQEDSPSRNASRHDPLHPKERTPVSVFYSYSHRDEKLRDRLAAHLSLLKREGAISEWHDRKITAGREWEGQIDAHLNSAQITYFPLPCNRGFAVDMIGIQFVAEVNVCRCKRTLLNTRLTP